MDHLPVYRQVEIFKRHGIKLSASTISGWLQEVASQLSPLYGKLVEDTLSSDYI
jgi:transposase